MLTLSSGNLPQIYDAEHSAFDDRTTFFRGCFQPLVLESDPKLTHNQTSGWLTAPTESTASLQGRFETFRTDVRVEATDRREMTSLRVQVMCLETVP